jgi:hypothetical protein
LRNCTRRWDYLAHNPRMENTIDASKAIEQVRGRVQPNSVYRAFREGRIRGWKEGHRIIFDRTSWEKWLEAAQLKHQLAAKYMEIRGQQPERRFFDLTLA